MSEYVRLTRFSWKNASRVPSGENDGAVSGPSICRCTSPRSTTRVVPASVKYARLRPSADSITLVASRITV